MKLTKETLKRIIKEELDSTLHEENDIKVEPDQEEAEAIAANPDAATKKIFSMLDKDPKVQAAISSQNSGELNEEDEDAFPYATATAATASPLTGLVAASIAKTMGLGMLAVMPAAMSAALTTIALAYLIDKTMGRDI